MKTITVWGDYKSAIEFARKVGAVGWSRMLLWDTWEFGIVE